MMVFRRLSGGLREGSYLHTKRQSGSTLLPILCVFPLRGVCAIDEKMWPNSVYFLCIIFCVLMVTVFERKKSGWNIHRIQVRSRWRHIKALQPHRPSAHRILSSLDSSSAVLVSTATELPSSASHPLACSWWESMGSSASAKRHASWGRCTARRGPWTAHWRGACSSPGTGWWCSACQSRWNCCCVDRGSKSQVAVIATYTSTHTHTQR